MGSVEHEDCKGMYSWWWDSHITPKNSKWLMENLTDMDAKIILMIKIIEEDADSFAKRAEMYYKRRPELMKLVEEFYRAYRALAERYDHAAGVLRQAHKTMAEAFPNQVPPISLENDELHKDILGQFSSFLDACEKNGALHLESKSTCSRNVMQSESRDGKENGNPICLATLEKRSVGISTDEIEETDETEGEILWLNKALAELEAEKEVYARQFQKSLERLSNFETELNRRVNEAEMEAQSLKKSLSNLESEKEANLAQYQMAVEKIQELERALLCAQGDADGVKQCAVKAEIEAGLLQKDLIALEAEKEAAVLERNRCLEKISNLEDKLVHSEENTKEIKEAAAVRCNHLLMTISNLEQELTRNRAQLLDFDLEKGSTKLKKSEEMCLLLERSNQTLQSALEALTKKMENQSEEMMEKQKEMGRLWTCVQEERLRFSEVQNCFQNLQNLHFEAQEQMRFLAMKLQEKTQLLEDMESHNRSLKDEIRKVHKENKNLSEVNMASSLLVKNLEDEILSMRETMQKLEADVEILIGERDSFLTKISDLKNELDCLKKRHCSVIEQVASVGLDPVCLGSAVKELLDRNLKLEEVCGLERREKVLLLEKLAASEELLKKDVLLESRILDLTVELEEYKCKLKTSEKSHESVLAESFTLISCLENTIHGSDELMGKKSFFKVSLSDENAAFEEKRDKAQDSEDLCLLNRITPSEDIERRRTVENLGVITASEDIERRFDVFQGQLGNLVRSYKELKVDYSVLKEERKSLISRIEELQLDLDREKQEHRCSVNLSQTRLADVEFKFLLLQQEAQSKDQEHEEDLERALYSHIHVFILQKFLQDLEGRNFSLTFRFQKLVDAWKFSQKQISFLEHENLEQHTELKLLSNKINVDRLTLYQIAETLEICARKGFNHHIDSDHDLGDVLERIHSLQDSICKLEEDNVKLVIDKSVIALLLEQLGLEVMKLATEKKALDQELKIKSENFDVLKCGLQKVIEMNEELKWKFSEGIDKEHLLKAEILSAIENEKVELLRKLEDLKMEYTEIQTAREDQKKQIMKLSEDYSRQIRESSFLCDAKQLLEAELIVRSINEAFLEEENHQLIEAYRIASEARLLETEQLKEKAQHLEVENDQLQLQLACHMPVLLSLGECISSLEKCAGIHMEMQKSNKEVVKEMNLITEPHAGITNSFEDRTSMVAVGLSASQALQIRIKAIQEALQRVEGTPGRENVRLNAKQDALESSRYVKHIPRKKEKESIGDGLANDLKMRKPMPQMTVMDNGLLTKDIMLDQISEYFPYRTRKVCPAEAEDRMLELWETSDSSGIIDLKVGKAFNMFDVPSDYYFAEADREHEGCDPSREMLDEKELGIDKLEIPESLTEPRRVRNKRKILERLHGNIQKLTNLQITVQDLSKKVEIMGKNGSEKGIEYSNVKEQLKEAQLTITKLFDSNNKLIRNAERRLSTSDEKAGRDTDDRGCARRLLSEQARRGSEKIGKLQLEVQKIQFLLVKLDEEKDSKVRMRVFERKTRVLLRDYLHGRSRNKQPTRKKSSPFCSCVQLPSKRQ